jgi:hypothetical protein
MPVLVKIEPDKFETRNANGELVFTSLDNFLITSSSGVSAPMGNKSIPVGVRVREGVTTEALIDGFSYYFLGSWGYGNYTANPGVQVNMQFTV